MNFIKNKIFILSGVVSVFVLGISFLLITYFFISNKKVDMTIDSIRAEENFLKEANKNNNKDLLNSFSKKVEAISESDDSQGDLGAPVQVIFYGDFTCPFSADLYQTLLKVKQEFGNQVLIAYRQYPARGNSVAKQASLVSKCAGDQGKFWEMLDKLFDDNKNLRLSSDQFKNDATSLGLDLDKFNKCVEGEEKIDLVKKDILGAIDLGILGTPAVFVNGESLPGAYPFDDFTGPKGEKVEGMKKVVERHLKK